MQINRVHLCYCSNIHPGESWVETFNNLKLHTTKVKKKVTHAAFGIGLRLSNQATIELLAKQHLDEFKNWLKSQNMYVFTMNGFPYGAFHNKPVKDQVHHPDWTTNERLDYTLRLIRILTELLPENIEGGISTSPISYKHWYSGAIKNNKVDEACEHLIKIAYELIKIKQTTGKTIHIDIEPEPDGILESSKDCINFFNKKLIPVGKNILSKQLNIKTKTAEKKIKDHIQICFDVCHFAIGYEEPETALKNLINAGINIGKIQISSALSSGELTLLNRNSIKQQLKQFNEPIYLHQAVVRKTNGTLSHFKDLGLALDKLDNSWSEIRTHYHVPIFTNHFEELESTQLEIKKTIKACKKLNVSNHFEVETYTWSILPKHLQQNIVTSIAREIEWARKEILA